MMPQGSSKDEKERRPLPALRLSKTLSVFFVRLKRTKTSPKGISFGHAQCPKGLPQSIAAAPFLGHIFRGADYLA